MHHSRLVRIHDELLVAHRQSAFQPPGRVQHEIDAARQVGTKVFADSKAA